MKRAGKIEIAFETAPRRVGNKKEREREGEGEGRVEG